MTAVATRPRSSLSRSSASTATLSEQNLSYIPHGAALDLFRCHAPEVLLAGPAGTGKSRACLEKVDQCLHKYDGARALAVRKTLVGLTSSGLVTYRKQVRNPGDRVTFFGGNKEEPAQYRYANGSVLVVGGLDKPSKIMSTEYDLIYVQEATELTIADWEALTTRNRYGLMPYQQVLADCNPDAPTHFLYQRCESGATLMLPSRHEDNPRLYDAERREWTEEGRRYIATLDRLTGVRKQRLRYGRWVAAEGAVYDEYDRGIHVIPRSALPPITHCIAGVDWGFTNPGVIGVFGVDYDGRLYLLHEIYRTRRQIGWWVAQAVTLAERYPIVAWTADPAEPSFIEQFQDAGLPVMPGYNAILPGIESVQRRLAVAEDGRPRLFFVDGALSEVDEEIPDTAPHSTLQEMPGYVWPQGVDGKPLKEIPVPLHDHGLDMTRYVCAMADGLGVVTQETRTAEEYFGTDYRVHIGG